MGLRELHELVQALGKRIDTHGVELSQNEALTRYSLIDPLLRSLGWDTEDPALVRPEYRTRHGSADYALLNSNKPVMMVEAKKLGFNLRGVLGQGITYCTAEGTPYFTITDGQRWEIYETFKPLPAEEKRIVQFDLKDDPVDACLQALALWRPNVAANLVRAGQSPIGLQHQTQVATDDEDSESSKWQSLSNFVPELKTSAPPAIKFPDNTSCANRYWYDLVLHTVRWLWESGGLHKHDQLPGFLTTSGGRKFRAAKRVIGTPFTCDRHGSANTQIQRVKRLLDDSGVSLTEVYIRLPT